MFIVIDYTQDIDEVVDDGEPPPIPPSILKIQDNGNESIEVDPQYEVVNL